MAQHGTHIAINISELGPGLYLYTAITAANLLSELSSVYFLFKVEKVQAEGGGVWSSTDTGQQLVMTSNILFIA